MIAQSAGCRGDVAGSLRNAGSRASCRVTCPCPRLSRISCRNGIVDAIKIDTHDRHVVRQLEAALPSRPGSRGNAEVAKSHVPAKNDPAGTLERARAMTPPLVSWNLSSFALGVVQVRASQGRRGRDTGSYLDRGERREVRAWAARSVKRLRFHGTRYAKREWLR
jgi:hypothetical protein